jgi:glycerol-3-phosphate dehydrogenase
LTHSVKKISSFCFFVLNKYYNTIDKYQFKLYYFTSCSDNRIIKKGGRGMDSKYRKVSKSLSGAGLTDIELTEWRKSIVLEGELADYRQVVKAGKAAANKGYKGVVNKISVKDCPPPEASRPTVQDGSLDKMQCDVLVIGGGVIGCSIAREFSKYRLNVLVVDKEADVAMQASSRNDGMIHPGIATHLHGNTAFYNVRGNAMYTALCKDLDIPFERRGNLILFDDRKMNLFCPALKLRAKQIGIPSRFWSNHRLHQEERNLSQACVSGMMFPTSGVLSPYKLTVALAENAIENGASFSLSTMVEGMELEKDKITAVKTNRGTVYPRLVVNAAGVFSDKIAAMANDQFFTIHPRKGEIALLDKKKGHLLSAAIGILSLKSLKSNTKGGGLVHTIDGNLLVGPSAVEIQEREDYSTDQETMDAVLQKQLPLVNGVDYGDVITYFAGVRAPTYEESFVVESSEYVENLVHAAGIQSPGLASAPAIAQDIVKISVDILSRKKPVEKNLTFNPRRRVLCMEHLSVEERQAAIRKNPDYGVIVCRCEGISKGEIIDALHSPLPVPSLDAIKRRIRPGMGRCQGGFCSPAVLQIIAQESKIPLTQVTKKGGGSLIAMGRTHKGEGMADDV